jgi:SAM-dependent methyltransferase
MGNSIPDWTAADRHPKVYACRKPWLPLSRDARILDFGCGWGAQLLALWCAGYKNIEGVEIGQEQAAIAQRAAGGRVPILCANASEYIKSRACTYDLIIINDVLEHIPSSEALSVMKTVCDALKPEGRVVVRVPNMSSTLASYSRYMDITHVAGYTEWSLMQLLDQAGFENHYFVDNSGGWDPKSWRPWAPLRGFAVRHLANLLIHRFLYAARGQRPVPTCIDYNVEIYSQKQTNVRMA